MKLSCIVSLTCFILMAFHSAQARNDPGLWVIGEVGTTNPYSPRQLTEYWSRSMHVGFGVGTDINDQFQTFILFHHNNFSQVPDIVPIDSHGTVNELAISLKRFARKRIYKRYIPFYQISLGVMLLRTPNIFREVEPGAAYTEEDFLQAAESGTGMSAGFSGGIHYEFDYQSSAYLEIAWVHGFIKQLTTALMTIKLGVTFEL